VGRRAAISARAAASRRQVVGPLSDCGLWNSLVEEVVGRASAAAPRRGDHGAPPVPLDSICADDAPRIPTGSVELDGCSAAASCRGAWSCSAATRVSARRPCCSSTSGGLAAARAGQVLYCSGEESPRQIKLRADRIGLATDRLIVFASGALEPMLAEIRRMRPLAAVVDSIQTVTTVALESTAGASARCGRSQPS